MKEIEILFKIEEEKAQELRQRLKGFFVKQLREVDTYFYPPHKDFLVSENGRENLRVRDAGTKKELTYKRVMYEYGKYSHSIEKNIIIPDAEKMIEILKILGFKTHLTVDKKREIFENDEFRITIDNVKSLGIFVEVEWNGIAESKNAIESCMKMANKLGLKKVQDKGYLKLIEEKLDLMR